MANLTISLHDSVLQAGRAYAKQHGVSLNRLIRTLLAKAVGITDRTASLTSCFRVMDKAKPNSRGRTWSRDELYRG